MTTETAALRAIVHVEPSGTSSALIGRAAAIAAFVALEAERINGAGCGSLTFNFDGGSLKPVLQQHYPHIKTND